MSPRLAVLLLLAVAATGCTVLDNFLASIPVFSFLRESPAFDPYEAPRPVPPGAVPYASPGGEPQPPLAATELALNEFGARTRNPIAPSETSLASGQIMFERHCAVCHGAEGRGNGPVVGPGRFPFAPNLTLPLSAQRSDGYLYGIIRVGRGLMPAYGTRMSHQERWHTVNYLRQLQGQAGSGSGSGPATGTGSGAATTSGVQR